MIMIKITTYLFQVYRRSNLNFVKHRNSFTKKTKQPFESESWFMTTLFLGNPVHKKVFDVLKNSIQTRLHQKVTLP